MTQLEDFLISPAGLIIASLGFWIVVGVIVVAVVAGGRRKAARIAESAASRGWQHRHERAGRRDAHIFEGRTRDGAAWEMESVYTSSTGSTTTSSGGSSHTRWSTGAVPAMEHAILIGPGGGNMLRNLPPGMSVNNLITRTALRLLFSQVVPGVTDQDLEKLLTIRPVETGSEMLRRDYTVMATDEEAARRVMSRVESVLVDWAMQERQRDRLPQIVLWWHGLSIRFGQRELDPDRLERIVWLGEALARACAEE